MQPVGAHLVGSVPLESAEAVFRTVSASLGRHLRSLPDGETGARKDWIAWQYAVLSSTPGLEPVPAGDRGYLRRQLVRLRGRGGPAPCFGALGYARAALDSFAIFDRLQREGILPSALCFQVSLPTALAPTTVFVDLPDRSVVEPAYEARLLDEVAQIVGKLPHERLAIQWDVAVELGLLEGVWPAHFDDVEASILARLARLARAVPSDVALGYHLCYGDFGHRHFTNPPDATGLVRLAGGIARTARAVDWVHLPVPIGWAQPSCFAPLRDLAFSTATRVFLGLLHVSDGLEGARRRIELAAEVVPRFGVATECGWGRRPADAVPDLLRLHAEVALASS